MEFGILFPSRYIEYLRSFPRIIEELAYDLEKWQSHISDEEFVEDPSSLIPLNREFREWYCEDEDGNPADPCSYWAIGRDLGGNFYLIRLAENDPRVYFYNHDSAQITTICKDLSDFPYHLLDLWEDHETE